MGVIKNTATRLPETRFALAQPILRPRHDWYTEKYDGLCRSFVAGVNSLGLENVAKLEAMPKASQSFVADKIHLTKESSEAYVNGLLFNSDSLFTAELVNLEAGTSKKPERLIEKVLSGRLESDFEKGVKSLEKKLVELNQEMFKRRFHDSLVMARLREDVDTTSNINKEDKMVISGLSSKTPKPVGRDETNKWLKEMVANVLDSIEPGISGEIIFVTQGRSGNREVPLAEVRMKNKEIALRLRKTYAQKKKAGKDFGRIYISNCVTLATRVRIEILKAMAKKFVSDTEEFYVVGYTSRPVLHVKTKNRNQKSMWLSFSDALVRYGSGLRENDLGEAYKKAGIAFKGQMEQNFVVLHDSFENPTSVYNPRQKLNPDVETPKKRQREDVDMEPEAKTPRKGVNLDNAKK